jgi:NAD(P)-dependent dehydrogenase (short-subunit alcohol dehydrogenase family)
MSLKNRTVVVSGAGGELGTDLARSLATQGANLALLGRNPEKLGALRAALALPEARLLLWRADLLQPGAAGSAAEAVAVKFGRVDALLHVVGGWTGGKTLLESDPEDLRSMLDQHVWTSFHAARAFLPRLLANGWGRIVMIGSPFAARPNAKAGPYAIGKAGQEALLLTLSQELRGTGVTANLLLAKSIEPQGGKPPATTFAELSAAVLYLLSDEAGAVNGARIPVYGGYL